MATYQLSEDQYVEITSGVKRSNHPRPIQLAIGLLVTVGLVIGSWTLGQYAFSVVLAIVVLVALFGTYRLREWATRKSFRMNPMKGSLYEIRFDEDHIEVTVGNNRLRLDSDDITYAAFANGVARLQHALGFELTIPRKSLSSEELSIMEKYKNFVSGSNE